MAALAGPGGGSLIAELPRFARFGCVGVVGIGINTLALWMLTEHVGFYYLVSSVLATEIAILHNFALNHLWTFGCPPGKRWHARLFHFNLIAIGGLVVTVISLFVLTHGAGLHYLPANLVAAGTGAVWNYSANRLWTWQGRLA